MHSVRCRSFYSVWCRLTYRPGVDFQCKRIVYIRNKNTDKEAKIIIINPYKAATIWYSGGGRDYGFFLRDKLFFVFWRETFFLVTYRKYFFNIRILTLRIPVGDSWGSCKQKQPKLENKPFPPKKVKFSLPKRSQENRYNIQNQIWKNSEKRM